MLRLLLELQVHQLELEMQNEELRLALDIASEQKQLTTAIETFMDGYQSGKQTYESKVIFASDNLLYDVIFYKAVPMSQGIRSVMAGEADEFSLEYTPLKVREKNRAVSVLVSAYTRQGRGGYIHEITSNRRNHP